jgi:oxidoreductase
MPGRELVGQLLSSGAWANVVTVGRREVAVPGAYAAAKGQLEQVTVDLDKMGEAAEAFRGASAVFCALGTTRKDAGSAEAFKRVDHEYVARSAELARQAGVPHFSLVTAAGANANLWASDLKLFHGLLYSKTKGLVRQRADLAAEGPQRRRPRRHALRRCPRLPAAALPFTPALPRTPHASTRPAHAACLQAEEAVKAQGFERVSIFRPGLLDRGDRVRPLEAVIAAVVPSIKVAEVARLMVLDAERQASGTRVFEMRHLQAAAKAGTAPEC